MVKTTVQVDGMMCGMCEAHVNDAIRRAFQVKKVTSSHTKKRTEILSEEALPPEQLQSVINATGYTAGNVESGTVKKKGFSLFHR